MVADHKGLFIAIDGIHGCGKTAVVKRLAGRSSKRGYSVIATREIGGSKLGEKIRKLMDDLDADKDAEASLLLVLAARAQHVEQLIRPSLAQNKVIITDRFTPSTYVYQYYCIEQFYQKENMLETVKHLNDFATNGLSPDITIILDVPVDIALDRKSQSQSIGKWEKKELKYHQRAREGYLHFAQIENWDIVNAGQSLKTVIEDVEKLVIPLLPCLDKA